MTQPAWKPLVDAVSKLETKKEIKKAGIGAVILWGQEYEPVLVAPRAHGILAGDSLGRWGSKACQYHPDAVGIVLQPKKGVDQRKIGE